MIVVVSAGTCRPSETRPLTATVSDPAGARVIVVAARSQAALDAGVQAVLLYRLDLASGCVE